MMQTLVPPPVQAQAHALGHRGKFLGYGLTARALVLLACGCLLAIPGFFHSRWVWAMAVWDALVLLLAIWDTAMLPAPQTITVERRFENSPVLGEATTVTLEITQESNQILDMRVTDALHPHVDRMPETRRVVAYPRDAARITITCIPIARGDVELGKVFLRYRGALRLVERWATVNLEQAVRVYPPMERSPENSSLYLLRIRQIALQKRKLRLRGTGREFESLREYQAGDEIRNVSWPATARRGKVITRQFTTERSQQVWIVLDAGRLSRTTFELRGQVGPHPQIRTWCARDLSTRDLTDDGHFVVTVTQLDQASGAAVGLAEAVMQAGDKAALMVYGRAVQQQLMPASGAAHLRQFVDSLSHIRAENAEANHLAAAARLKSLQRRRGLILWITELADSARRPEVVDAVVNLSRLHLVLLVLLTHPELDALAKREPQNVEDMFVATAAAEVLERRRSIVAALRAQGVMVVETTSDAVKSDAINEYLEVKARGIL